MWTYASNDISDIRVAQETPPIVGPLMSCVSKTHDLWSFDTPMALPLICRFQINQGMSFVPKKIVNEEVEVSSECHINKVATAYANRLYPIYDEDKVSCTSGKLCLISNMYKCVCGGLLTECVEEFFNVYICIHCVISSKLQSYSYSITVHF